MKTIWKASLAMSHSQQVQMPADSRLLHTAEQDGQITIWFLCETTNQMTERTFYIRGTGHDLASLPREASYLATVPIGSFVWHVFIER